MNTKITTFIFDCFGVICSEVIWNWYREERMKRGFIDEGLKRVLKEFDLGKLSKPGLVGYFLKYEGINSSKEKLQEKIDSYFTIDYTIVKTIQKLKNKGFKTALLSNGNADFFKRKIYTTYPNFKNLFDEIIISSEVKMVKPDKEIYLYTLKKVNSKPEETLFIDDNKENIEVIAPLGIKGFVYTDSSSFSGYIKKLGIDLK